MRSVFERVPSAPPDPILELTAAFQKDVRKNKVNLGVGLYKTEELKTPILASVKAAETALLDIEKSKEYLPIHGDPLFLDQMGKLVFGEELWTKEKSWIASFQTVGGTAALKIGGTFLKEEIKSSIWISSPTWPNHRAIFLSCGLSVESYSYYDKTHHVVDFTQIQSCLEKLPEKTIVLMQVSCHNPTGSDLSHEDWKVLSELFKAKRLIPFFDFAYQGFGYGVEEDAEPVRLFLKNKIEMLVAVSSAKNFSIYSERVGSLFIVAESTLSAERILSRVKQIVRTTYSNPPLHGAEVVTYILSTSSLRQKWERELQEMRERIRHIRMDLFDRLAAKGKAEAFRHFLTGKGMFGFTGLTPSQVEKVISEYGIYMTNDGRINVCGLNRDNLDYVAQAFVSVMEKNKDQ